MSEEPGDYQVSRSDNKKMERIDFTVPQGLLEQARELAEFEGYNFSEFCRVIWEKGLAVHAEGSNKRLVNEKLRKKSEE
jgi:hypothetical protein